MTIPVHCADCDKTYQVKPELAGKRGKCPRGHTLLIPAAEGSAAAFDLAKPAAEPTSRTSAVAPSPALTPPPTETAGEITRCPSCWAEMQPDAVRCVACGLDTRSGRKHGPPRRKKERAARSALPAFVPWLVAGLMLLLGGVGALGVWVIGQSQASALQKKLTAAEQQVEDGAADTHKRKQEVDRLRAENGDLKTRVTAAERIAQQAADGLTRRVAELGKKSSVPNTPVVAMPPGLGKPAQVPVAAAPGAEAIPTTEPRGGTSWSVPASVSAGGGGVFRAGTRLWIWPAEDKPLQAALGQAVFRFKWHLRPGQTMPANPFVTFVIRGNGFTTVGLSKKIDMAATSGTETITVQLKDLSGSGTIHFCISDGNVFGLNRDGPTAYSNLLAIKASF